MDKITTTIKRQWLAEIAAKRKLIEYRNIKPYWTRRLDGVEAPFLLRLINGMQQNAPELTVIVDRVRKNSRHGDYELHLGEIIEVRNWSVRREQPTRSSAKRRTRRQTHRRGEIAGRIALQSNL